MVGYAVLRKIVCSDLLTAVAGAHHGAALFRNLLLLLFEPLLIKPRTQNAHGLGAVLDLRLLVLARNHHAGGEVRDANRGISGIHRLSAWSGRTEGMNA